jgi:hypothetical protein
MVDKILQRGMIPRKSIVPRKLTLGKDNDFRSRRDRSLCDRLVFLK